MRVAMSPNRFSEFEAIIVPLHASLPATSNVIPVHFPGSQVPSLHNLIMIARLVV